MVWIYCAYLGAVLGGYVPTMFSHPSAKHREDVYFKTVFELIDTADAKLLVADQPLAEKLQRELNQRDGALAVVSLEQAIGEILTGDAIDLQVSTQAADIVFLQYSSGTTGLKKAVAIIHNALWWRLKMGLK